MNKMGKAKPKPVDEQIRFAEECVGASLFIDPDQYHIVFALKTAKYTPRLPQFRELVDVIAEETRKRGGVNLPFLLSTSTYNYWENVSAKFATQLNFPQKVEESIEFLIQVARQDKIRATLESSLSKLEPSNLPEILSTILDEISMTVTLGKAETLTGEAIRVQMERNIENIYTYKKFPVYTHFPFLDERGIFLARREYSLFSGRTGVGKTSCAAILTFNLLTSHLRNDEFAAPYPLRVLFLSTEMPAESIIAKLLGTFTHCYILERLDEYPEFDEKDVEIMSKLRWNDFYTKTKEEHLDTVKKILAKFVEFCGDRVAIYHNPIVTTQDIFLVGLTQAVKWEALGGGLDVYIVDFIQNVRTKSEMEGGTRRQEGLSLAREIAMVAQEFQLFCHRFNTAGVLLSQVNDMGEIRDSRVVEHLAALHVQLGLYQRDLVTLFKQFFMTVGQWEGKPLNYRDMHQKALRYARALQEPSAIRYLDARVVKNRYGDVIRNVHFFIWNPAIPKIVEIADISVVAKELAKVVEPSPTTEEGKDASVDMPLDANNVWHTEKEFPF